MGRPEELLILLVLAWPLGPPFPACSLPLGHKTLTQCTSNFSFRGQNCCHLIFEVALGSVMITSARDTDTFRNDLSLPEGASSIVEGSVLQAPSHGWNAFFISLGGWSVGQWALPSEIKLFRKAFHFCQFLANAKLTKAVAFHSQGTLDLQMALTVSIFVPPLVRRVPVSLYCYSRQYYWFRFCSFTSLFCTGLKVKKGWGCGSVGKRRACPCSSEQPKHGAMCLSSRAGRSDVQGHPGLHGETSLAVVDRG